jgi:hypothetical protein
MHFGGNRGGAYAPENLFRDHQPAGPRARKKPAWEELEKARQAPRVTNPRRGVILVPEVVAGPEGCAAIPGRWFLGWLGTLGSEVLAKLCSMRDAHAVVVTTYQWLAKGLPCQAAHVARFIRRATKAGLLEALPRRRVRTLAGTASWVRPLRVWGGWLANSLEPSYVLPNDRARRLLATSGHGGSRKGAVGRPQTPDIPTLQKQANRGSDSLKTAP